MATGVYIDGFNLYYGSLRGSTYKWLDLQRLAACLLPREEITCIRYFTAKINGEKDPYAPQRQQTYLHALATLDLVQIKLGMFKSQPVLMPRHPEPTSGPKFVQVLKTEEKGSDVNLGCHALLDALRNRVDTVVLISNDSDLLEPIRLIKNETSSRVGVINPHSVYKRSEVLHRHADFSKQLTNYHLQQSQFPEVINLQNRKISKPKGW